MSATIEDAIPADAAAIRRLAIGGSTARLLEGDLADADRPSLVARHDGEVVGVAVGMLLLDEGHVNDLAVADVVRGQGLGGRLLVALEAALADRGAASTTLEVRASNVAARALYHRHGYVQEGRRPGYYPDGEDALILWRRSLPAGDGDEQGRDHGCVLAGQEGPT